MKILIIDDSSDDRLLLITILKLAGFHDVVEVPSARDAFVLLGIEEGGVVTEVDLVLMDLTMPGVDGMEALRRIKQREKFRHLPIIMVTGNTDVENLANAFSAGATDYICKPLRKMELLARINAVIALEEANQALRRSEKRLRDLTAALAEGLFSVDRQGVTFLNPAGERLLGWQEAHVLGKSLHALIHPDGVGCDGGINGCFLDRVWHGNGDGEQGESFFVRQDGSRFPVSYTVAALFEEQKVTGAVVTFQDITERKRVEEKLRLAASVLLNSQEGITITDPHAVIQEINPAFTQLTGYLREEVIGRTPAILHSGLQDKSFYQEMWTAMEHTGHWQGELWNRRKNGTLYPEWLSISAIWDEHGQLSHYVGIFSDITVRKLSEERLEYMAHNDILTDLPNRTLLYDRLQQGIRQAQREQKELAVLFLDLDRFKPINDLYGHDAGDQVLREVARRIRWLIRKSDTAARVGGDEFVVVLLGIQAKEDACAVADKILASLSQEFSFSNFSCSIGVSIGIAFYPEDGEEPEGLLKHADAEMYRAKQEGRNCYRMGCGKANSL